MSDSPLPPPELLGTSAPPAGAWPAPRLRGRRLQRCSEAGVRVMLGACATFSIATTFAIVIVLMTEASRFFRLPEVSLGEFFLSTRWEPLLGHEHHFGIWPLVTGTLLVGGVAALVALPIGLVTAIYLSEYAPRRVRAVLKPVLEILAGIPTVVYGFFALTVITPALQRLHGGLMAAAPEPGRWPQGLYDFVFKPVGAYNAFSAGLAVGIMCLPIVCSLSEDALRAVPRSLREGAYATGATKFDVSVKVVLPAALSGVMAAFLLAIARAVGETMIVALAAGGLASMTFDPRDQTQTMTAYMVQIFLGDTAAGGVEYRSAYAVAAMLFLMTLLLTIIGSRVLARFREAYQ